MPSSCLSLQGHADVTGKYNITWKGIPDQAWIMHGYMNPGHVDMNTGED